MKKWIVILSMLLMVSVCYGANVDLKIDGTQYTCTPSGSPPIVPPIVPPIPPTPPPTPPPSACQPEDISFPVSRVPIGSGTYCIPANRPALLIQAIGTTNETNAQLTWTFPDGRVFPTDPEFGKILGTGTYSVNMRLRSQSTFSSNIPDQYIPAGRHRLTITGNASGWMSVEW